MDKIILSADCSCDIGAELRQRYKVQFFYYHIQVGGRSYLDTMEIHPEDIYHIWSASRILPTIAAITPEEYYSQFSRWVEAGYKVIHLNIGSALSSAHQNCRIAANRLEGVYPVDTGNLSAGTGIFVVKAGRMIEAGCPIDEILQVLGNMRHKAHASFVVETLEYLQAGGRCSALTTLGANILQIKPCLEVHSEQDGALAVGKKYRGRMEKVLDSYVRDKLNAYPNLDSREMFVTHSGSPLKDIKLVIKLLRKYGAFKEIHVTRTSCTIAAHCGPRTLGMLLLEQ